MHVLHPDLECCYDFRAQSWMRWIKFGSQHSVSCQVHVNDRRRCITRVAFRMIQQGAHFSATGCFNRFQFSGAAQAWASQCGFESDNWRLVRLSSRYTRLETSGDLRAHCNNAPVFDDMLRQSCQKACRLHQMIPTHSLASRPAKHRQPTHTHLFVTRDLFAETAPGAMWIPDLDTAEQHQCGAAQKRMIRTHGYLSTLTHLQSSEDRSVATKRTPSGNMFLSSDGKYPSSMSCRKSRVDCRL